MKSIGNKGEDLAVKFLKKKGYFIIERNFKTKLGEIDIIAKDKNTIVFVEVKTRTNDYFGYPFEAINEKKKNRLKNLALIFMKRYERELPIRFDVVSIFYMSGGNKKIQHIKDAFEF